MKVRYGIVSDIHGNDANLAYALRALADAGAETYVCLGDVIGKSGSSMRCIDMLLERDAAIVSGNHETLALQRNPSDKPGNPFDRAAMLQARMKKVIVKGDVVFSHTATCHGARYGLPPWNDERGTRISNIAKASEQFKEPFRMFFYGHSHEAMLFSLDADSRLERMAIETPCLLHLDTLKRYLCNPGPVTDRRDIEIENPHRKGIGSDLVVPSFVLYDDVAQTLRYFFKEGRDSGR